MNNKYILKYWVTNSFTNSCEWKDLLLYYSGKTSLDREQTIITRRPYLYNDTMKIGAYTDKI